MKTCIKLLITFIVLYTSNIFAQPYSLSEDAEISIITVGPGANLYDKFGHSAFHVKDEANNIDYAYNFGTYDFNTPNFYTKFAQGKLLYSLSVSYFEAFLNYYQSQNRWVKEQRLNLTAAEKKAVFEFLQQNAKPENKDYKYDFFFDNCATRIRDVLVTALKNKITYTDSFVKESYTFRELIQKNVDANTWGSLGMDVAIGAVVDRKATAWQYQFLPQYVFEAAAVATINHQGKEEPLVNSTVDLFKNEPSHEASNFFTSPLFVFGLIAMLILYITYRDYQHKERSRLLDSILFMVTGIIGVFLLLLWFATDHSATAMNYNLLWAFPLSILVGPLLARSNPPKWIRKYIFFLLILMALMVLHSLTGVQTFAIGLIPFFVALTVRYVYLLKRLPRPKASQ